MAASGVLADRASSNWRAFSNLLLPVLMLPLLWLMLLFINAGVGAGSPDLRTMRLSGVAGLVAGALSMACGAWRAGAGASSVSQQRA